MEEHMDKATLLDNMSAGYDALEKLLTPLIEAQMTAPGVNGEWSIKDVLVHLTAWQKRLLIDMQAATDDEKAAISTVNISGEETDRLNEQFYKENKFRPLKEVLADFQSTHSQMLAAVMAMTNEELVNPQRFSWTNGKPLWQFVASETYEHILEHVGSIYAWLAKARQGQLRVN